MTLDGLLHSIFMLYMVVERFRRHDAGAIYARLRECGRMMPEGLRYIDSWIEPNCDRCFQVMETDNPALFELLSERKKRGRSRWPS